MYIKDHPKFMARENSTYSRIGFIGTGKMAESIISSLVKGAGKLEIHGIEPSEARKQELKSKYGVNYTKGAAHIIENCNPLFLAVKPQNLEEVLTPFQPLWPENGKDKILISILAGTPRSKIAKLVSENTNIIRVMPNTPGLIGKGISAVSFHKKIDKSSKDKIMNLLDGLGHTLEINEDLMNAVTALSGSGPAYVYSFIQGLIDGGVHLGLPRASARKLALETVIGAASMVKETGEEPYKLRSDVASPGGTTIAGLKVLQENAFEGIIMNAIEGAYHRGMELEETRNHECNCDCSHESNPESNAIKER